MKKARDEGRLSLKMKHCKVSDEEECVQAVNAHRICLVIWTDSFGDDDSWNRDKITRGTISSVCVAKYVRLQVSGWAGRSWRLAAQKHLCVTMP